MASMVRRLPAMLLADAARCVDECEARLERAASVSELMRAGRDLAVAQSVAREAALLAALDARIHDKSLGDESEVAAIAYEDRLGRGPLGASRVPPLQQQ